MPLSSSRISIAAQRSTDRYCPAAFAATATLSMREFMAQRGHFPACSTGLLSAGQM
jgi:hypothetical protein